MVSIKTNCVKLRCAVKDFLCIYIFAQGYFQLVAHVCAILISKYNMQLWGGAQKKFSSIDVHGI